MASSLFLQQNVVKVKREQAWGYQDHVFLAGKKSQQNPERLGLSLFSHLKGKLLGRTSCHALRKIRGLRRQAPLTEARRRCGREGWGSEHRNPPARRQGGSQERLRALPDGQQLWRHGSLVQNTAPDRIWMIGRYLSPRECFRATGKMCVWALGWKTASDGC